MEAATNPIAALRRYNTHIKIPPHSACAGTPLSNQSRRHLATQQITEVRQHLTNNIRDGSSLLSAHIDVKSLMNKNTSPQRSDQLPPILSLAFFVLHYRMLTLMPDLHTDNLKPMIQHGYISISISNISRCGYTEYWFLTLSQQGHDSILLSRQLQHRCFHLTMTGYI